MHASGKQLNQNNYAELKISRLTTQPQILIKISELAIDGLTLGTLIRANGLKGVNLRTVFTRVHLVLKFSVMYFYGLKIMHLYINTQSLFWMYSALFRCLDFFTLPSLRDHRIRLSNLRKKQSLYLCLYQNN